MKWKNFKLRTKFAFGFGAIIVLLIVIASWLIVGIGGITLSANKVISGNRLNSSIMQCQIDHLNWLAKVNELLTDENVIKLDVETDPHKCGFGKWYYGQGRQDAEELIPELKLLLDDIEESHIKLHESAIKISNVFVQSDRKRSSQMHEIKNLHLEWMQNVLNILTSGKNETIINVQKDHTKCALGTWLNSKEIIEFSKLNPTFASYINEIIQPHIELYESVINIEQLLRNKKSNSALNYYRSVTKNSAENVFSILDQMISWNDNQLMGMDKANEIYTTETTKNLHEVGNLLTQIVEKSKVYILANETKLQEKETETRNMVILISIIVTIISILLAIIFTRSISKPILKGVDFAKAIAKGDLTVRIDVL